MMILQRWEQRVLDDFHTPHRINGAFNVMKPAKTTRGHTSPDHDTNSTSLHFLVHMGRVQRIPSYLQTHCCPSKASRLTFKFGSSVNTTSFHSVVSVQFLRLSAHTHHTWADSFVSLYFLCGQRACKPIDFKNREIV